MQILGSKLPSNKDVLCVFFYNMRTVKLNVEESARLAIRETMVFWKKAHIPLQKEPNWIIQLKNLYEEWMNLEKNSTKRTEIKIITKNCFWKNWTIFST